VFQRTELARGDGAIQFTVFNGTAQGVFDSGLDESFSTRGLGFLMRLGEPQKPLEAFDCMLETARAVAKYCDGELRDDTNSVFTQQTGEHCRERIRDFALRARARR
jgi:cell division protein ZipA